MMIAVQRKSFHTPPNVKIWWAKVHYVRPGLAQLLNPVEQQRHSAFRQRSDADRFLLGVAITRIVAGHELGLRPGEVTLDRRCLTCGKPHGKVEIADSGLHISITHSGQLVGVAFSRNGPVGLDVEQLVGRPDHSDLIDNVLSPIEADSFANVDLSATQEAFLRYWVRKEALVKATGDGISSGLASITVTSYDQSPSLLSWAERPELPTRTVMYDTDPQHGYISALAIVADKLDTATFEARDAAPLLQSC